MENLVANTIINHPYLVYKDNTKIINQIEGNLSTVLPTLPSLDGKTTSILEAQMNTERAKEQKFISHIVEVMNNDQLNALYYGDNKGKYSQIVTLFDAWERGLAKDCKNIEEALIKIKQYYDNFSFNAGKKFIMDYFDKHKDFVGKNISNVFEELTGYVNECFKDENIQSIYKEAIQILERSYFGKKQHLKNDQLFTAEDAIRQPNLIDPNSKTILEQLRSELHGIFSGQLGEAAAKGGWTGMQSKGGKNPDTDTIRIYSGNLLELTETEQALSLEKTYEEMRLAEKELKDCYIIHYSVKAGSGSSIKIKDEANLGKRLEDIKNMFHELKLNNYQNFIFTLANTVPEMAAEGRFEDIKKSIIQLTTMYMFDDILPTVAEGVNQDTHNTEKLNFYNIGGRIFTASEIFGELLRTTNGSINNNRPQVISLSAKFKKIDYDSVTKGITDEKQRWDAVYEAAMSANKISMLRLNVKNLVKALLS